MTNQEAFDRMVRHLAAQGETCGSRDEHGYFTCWYRKDGLKCAVGALIPDSQYRPGLEKIEVSDLVLRGEVPALRGLSRELLSDCQFAHDHTVPRVWPGRLRAVAKRYELDPSVIDQVEWKGGRA